MFNIHMLHWYEGFRQLWIQRGPKWDEALLNLSEDFFDALMVSYKTAYYYKSKCSYVMSMI